VDTNLDGELGQYPVDTNLEGELSVYPIDTVRENTFCKRTHSVRLDRLSLSSFPVDTVYLCV
jgi:hypothetical protein